MPKPPEKKVEHPKEPEPPRITGKNVLATFKSVLAVARERKLEKLARKHPFVGDAIKERDALREQIAKLTAKKADKPVAKDKPADEKV